MLATANKQISRVLPSLLVLLVLSACASRGGVDSAPLATAEELGLATEADAEVVVAEPAQAAEDEAVKTPAEYPTLFATRYSVKGSNEHQLKPLWSKLVSGDGGLLLHFRPALNETQACAAGRGAVYCFDRESGERLWKHKVRDLASGLVFSSTLLLVGTDEGEVVALSKDDGSEQWRATVGGEVLALTAVGKSQVGELIIAKTSAGNLTGLRARDGETVWVQEQKVPRLTIRGLGTPLVVDDVVVSGHDNGRVTANKLLDGSALWADELVSPAGRNELERLADVDGALAHYRGDVFAASWGGKLGAWSLKRGRALWRTDIASVSGVAADLRRVYVTDANNALHAIDARSGRVLWKREDLVNESEKDKRHVIATTVIDGAPLVLDNLGRVYLYGRATGELDFAKSIPGEYAAAPAIDGKQVLTLSRGGALNLWQLEEAK